VVYRKGEQSRATIDREWPHQLALSAGYLVGTNCIIVERFCGRVPVYSWHRDSRVDVSPGNRHGEFLAVGRQGTSGWTYRHLRWNRRRRLSPVIRGAQTWRRALRLRLYGERARERPPAFHLDVAPTVYLWKRLLSVLPGRNRPRMYSINLMRALHPGWFREDLERLFGMLAAGAIRPRVAHLVR
jgi:hypothetical protein